MWLGIDFGTCYSSAAVMQNGRLEMVKETTGHGFSYPSSVYLTKTGEIVVGQAAENQRRMDPSCYQREFKRELGNPNPYILGNRQVLPEDLVQVVLQKLKDEAEKLAGEPLHKVVVTVPATYQAHKRDLMRKAAEASGFSQIELLEEPVAAAIYYYKSALGGQPLHREETLLVYDLGGGTFDAALLQQQQGGGYQFLGSPVGDAQCGGIDFDKKIYAHLQEHCAALKELLNPQRRDIEALRARLMVGDFCRTFKHQLSEVEEFEDTPPGSLSESYQLTRNEFNALIQEKIESTIQKCLQLLAGAEIAPSQIDRILLVGGSCRIPYIREVLEQKLKSAVVRVDDPELAVCRGAALYGSQLEKPLTSSASPLLKEVFEGSEQLATTSSSLIDPSPLSIDPTLLPTPPTPLPTLSPLAAVTLTRTLTGHQKEVRSVGFTSNSSILFSASHDKTVRFWELESGRWQGSVRESAGWVLASLSQDDQWLFTTSEDKTIKVWDAKTGKRLQTLKGHLDLINALVVSQDSQTIVTGSRDRSIKVWQLSNSGGKVLHSILGHQGFIYTIAVSPNWQVIASGGSGKIVYLWELGSGKLLHQLEYSGFVRAMAFSPDGQMLALGGFGNTISIWDWQQRKLRYQLTGHTRPIRSLAISLDGSTLVSGSEDCTIKLWNLATGASLNTLTGHTGSVIALAINASNHMLASGSEDHTIRIWESR